MRLFDILKPAPKPLTSTQRAQMRAALKKITEKEWAMPEDGVLGPRGKEITAPFLKCPFGQDKSSCDALVEKLTGVQVTAISCQVDGVWHVVVACDAQLTKKLADLPTVTSDDGLGPMERNSVPSATSAPIYEDDLDFTNPLDVDKPLTNRATTTNKTINLEALSPKAQALHAQRVAQKAAASGKSDESGLISLVKQDSTSGPGRR